MAENALQNLLSGAGGNPLALANGSDTIQIITVANTDLAQAAGKILQFVPATVNRADLGATIISINQPGEQQQQEMPPQQPGEGSLVGQNGLFWTNSVNIVAADVLAPVIAKSSVAMVLTPFDSYVYVSIKKDSNYPMSLPCDSHLNVEKWLKIKTQIHVSLTHCGLVTPCWIMKLCQHWFR